LGGGGQWVPAGDELGRPWGETSGLKHPEGDARP
jgi:hypothetical protein